MILFSPPPYIFTRDILLRRYAFRALRHMLLWYAMLRLRDAAAAAAIFFLCAFRLLSSAYAAVTKKILLLCHLFFTPWWYYAICRQDDMARYTAARRHGYCYCFFIRYLSKIFLLLFSRQKIAKQRYFAFLFSRYFSLMPPLLRRCFSAMRATQRCCCEKRRRFFDKIYF